MMVDNPTSAPLGVIVNSNAGSITHRKQAFLKQLVHNHPHQKHIKLQITHDLEELNQTLTNCNDFQLCLFLK